MTLDPDLERALRVLRYWLGDVEVLAVVVRGPGNPPRLDQPMLFDQEQGPMAQVDPAVRPGSRPARRATN
jgi:hypothetical protein